MRMTFSENTQIEPVEQQNYKVTIIVLVWDPSFAVFLIILSYYNYNG